METIALIIRWIAPLAIVSIGFVVFICMLLHESFKND